ncbi:major facilitator superfamily domain-containing protein 6-like [Oratosquilla oratoria]|uniref:major facilitator superfamily domain-containing protein 6-like n=1 Tax=Oratosquilla oratoria TaxID=337810 RepID=UPI003F7699A5
MGVLVQFRHRFWSDFTRKEFAPLKLLFFLVFGGSMTLFPFITIHMRSLGITESELAIISALQPIVALVGPSLAGMLADRIGNFKIFLSFVMACSGFAALLFLAIPPARVTHTMPDLLPLSMACSSTSDTPKLFLQTPYECDLQSNATEITVTLQYCRPCGTHVEVCETNATSSSCQTSTLPPFGLSTFLALALLHDSADGGKAKPIDHTMEILKAKEGICSSMPELSVERTSYAIDEAPDDGTPDPECEMECDVVVDRRVLCKNTRSLEVLSPATTFALYLLVRFLNALTLATSFPLFEGAVMAVLQQNKGDFGLQRLYANLGSIILTPISGSLIDYVSKKNGFQDFSPAFYMYFCIKMVAAGIILLVNLEFKKPSNSVLKDFKKIIVQPQIITFLSVMLVSGMCFGFLDTFLFWFLEDLGANKMLMGVTVTVGALAGIPLLMASATIITTLGHVNTIIMGFAFYVLRMLGYSFLTSAWWSMPFEALECFTVSLMYAASTTYAAKLATPATLATMQGLYGGLHHGVGRGLGSLVGGFLLLPLGVRNTFRLMSVVCAVTCVGYFLVSKFFFRKIESEQDLEKNEEVEEKKQQLDDEKSPMEDYRTEEKDEKSNSVESENNFCRNIDDNFEDSNIIENNSEMTTGNINKGYAEDRIGNP